MRPRHIAVVMDGNGRWASYRGLPRIAGHRAGVRAFCRIVGYAVERKIEVLTLFAFSIENQARPQSEVNFLMSLFLDSLRKNIEKLHKNNVQLRVIGDHRKLNKKMSLQIQTSQYLTQYNTGLKLIIALNYSGRWDIVQAVKQVAKELENRKLTAELITTELFQSYLCLSDLIEPDLLIRTSGEQRLSNFMLWQFAYTEIYFTPTLWPDFNEEIFDQALIFYCTRQRRFGLTSEQVKK